MEIFDSGNLWFAKQLVAEGLIEDPPLFQLCLGIPWGAPFDSETMAYQKAQLPKDAIWAAFGIGRNEFPAVAQAVLLGGHVRVGLEDNLWLEKGVPATNGKPARPSATPECARSSVASSCGAENLPRPRKFSGPPTRRAD